MSNLSTVTQPTIQAIYAAWEKRGNSDKGHRPHLGASVLGNECSRALWYSFRWCTDKLFGGRMLRLFNRGQLEESRFVQELKWAGVTVYESDPNTGRQYKWSDCGGHVGGSCDGFAIGIHESPQKWHVCEFKTHGAKSFKDLSEKGVEQSKPQHYTQMMIYMHWSGIDRAFYLSVNKDTDELYSERIRYDVKHADQQLRKAWDVVQSPTPLEKLSDQPGFFKCNFCDHKAICHGRDLPAVNCRTCVHATPEMDGNGGWSCAFHRTAITVNAQRQGCPHHRFVPQLVTWATQVDASDVDNWIEYEFNGKRFRNGDRGHESYPSEELRQVVPEVLGDAFAAKLRDQFGGFYAENIPVVQVSA